MLIRKLFVFVFLIYSSFSYADVSNFDADLNNIIKDESAAVINLNNNILEIDKGINNGFLINRKVILMKKGEPVYHPVTKELLGTRDIKIGEGVVKEAIEDRAKIQVTYKSADILMSEIKIVPKTPLGLCFTSIGNSDENKKYMALLKESLNNNSNYIISDNCQLNVAVKSDETGVLVSVGLQNNDILKTYYYPKGNIINIRKEVKAVDLVDSGMLNEDYHTLTIFNLANKKIIAAANKYTVDFYEVTGQKIEKAPYESIKTSEIVNVESFDIDKDGNEELIVSKLDKNLIPDSSIYKFVENKFEKVNDNIKYLFRTVYYNHKKELLYQSVSHERFDDNIYSFTSIDKLGNDTPKLISTEYNIYNIGFGDFNNDKKVDILYYDKDRKIQVISDGKVIYKSAKQYGIGAKYFILNKAAKNKDNHGYSENDDVLGMLKYRYYIYPRVYENDSQIFVYNNELKFPAFPLREVFSTAKVEKISFNNSGIERVWESDLLEPRLIDIYTSPESGETYLAMIKLKESFLLKNDKSNLIIIKFN